MLTYLALILTLSFTVLIPGYFLAQVILPKRVLEQILRVLSPFNAGILRRYFYFLLAPATGLILLDTVVFLLEKFGQKIGRTELFLAFLSVNLLLGLLSFSLKNKKSKEKKEISLSKIKKNQWLLYAFIAIWSAGILLRTVFYLPDVLPQNTDLGHHMYWSELLIVNEKIPTYDTSEVIVGEHLIFGVLGQLSGISLLSALPLIILAFYNLFLILVIPAVSLALFNNRRLALLAFFFGSFYFAIDSPQAKFVRGGVIGNTFGNLFILLSFFLLALFFRYFNEKMSQGINLKKIVFQRLSCLVSLIFILLGGALYTHHLSAFLLIFCLFFVFLAWFVATFFSLKRKVKTKEALKKLFFFAGNLLFRPRPLLAILFILTMLFVVYTPFYLKDQALSTVTRAPLKESHLGVSFLSAPDKFGKVRLILSFVGILGIIFFSFKRFGQKIQPLKAVFEKYRKITPILWIFFFGWIFPLFVLTFIPWLFRIDLPSQRVINYLLLPAIFLAGLGAELIFLMVKDHLKNKKVLAVLGLFLFFTLWEGTVDFRTYFSWDNKFQETVELYEASKYLRDNSKPEDGVLKDHVSLVGDAWIKFFLLRGYDYFISRTYDYKYEVYDPYNEVDSCPKDMIDVPESGLSETCYGQTGISYVILRPKGEKFFFFRAKDFNTIYASDSVSIFKK